MNKRRSVIGNILIAAVCCLALFVVISGCDPSGEAAIEVKDETGTVEDAGTVDFGSCVCGSSLDKTFELRNRGNKAVEIREISLTNSEGSEFELNSPFQGSLGTDSTGSFYVVFAPTAAGDYSAQVHIDIADTEDHYNFTVIGSGTGPGGGSITLSPPSWIIGDWAAASGNTYSFTSDDVIVNGSSFKAHNEANSDHPENCYTEGENSSTLYVINVPGGYSYSFSNAGGDSNPSSMEVTITTTTSVTETANRQ